MKLLNVKIKKNKEIESGILVPFNRASKDLDRFPPLTWKSKWEGKPAPASKDLPEIKKSKDLDKVHFSEVGRLKSRLEGKMPFLCLS